MSEIPYIAYLCVLLSFSPPRQGPQCAPKTVQLVCQGQRRPFFDSVQDSDLATCSLRQRWEPLTTLLVPGHQAGFAFKLLCVQYKLGIHIKTA